jgi:long-chain acyl-CoA synthetase
MATSIDFKSIDLKAIFCGVDTGVFDADDEQAPPSAIITDEGFVRNSLCKENLIQFTSAGEDVKTLYATFQYGANRDPKSDCMGKRADVSSPYVWKSYEDIQVEAAALGSFLKGLGIQPNDRVGLSGKNTPEYLTAIQGCYHAGVTTVPIYDTFGEVECKYIMMQADIKCVFVSAANLSNVLEWSKEVDSVKNIVVWGGGESTETDDKVVTYEACVGLGKASPVDATPPTAEDLALIMYTSGTT